MEFIKLTIVDMALDLKEQLRRRNIYVGNVTVEDDDVSYPVIRLQYTDDIDEEELDNIVEVIREEIRHNYNLDSIYDEYENRYIKYEVALIESNWPSFNIYLQERK